ncbi:MAG: hypothetical protein IJ719_03545 [Clostridia bacterium]|nr:hypothetical protein [Clostridia bacterium]
MSIVLQFDSRQNVTYAYHNEVKWDSQLKRSNQKRTLIGRIDPETSLIIPTSGKRRKNVVDDELIKEEIEAYNNERTSTSSKQAAQNQDLERRYKELLSKYNEISQALISFSKVIQKIYDV